MKETVRTYEAEDIIVQYDVVRCIHARECVRGLPSVFDPEARPWVQPARDTADAIAEVILRCPTGALHFDRKDGGAAEPTPVHNRIAVAPDGPLYVRGDVEIRTPDGTVLLKDTRVALCRCGASQHKPLCDGSHAEAGFQERGRLGEAKVKPPEEDADGVLRITLAPNGPLLIKGPLMLVGGDETVRGGQTALCRCGGSSNKPFCDGTHKRNGFVAD